MDSSVSRSNRFERTSMYACSSVCRMSTAAGMLRSLMPSVTLWKSSCRCEGAMCAAARRKIFASFELPGVRASSLASLRKKAKTSVRPSSSPRKSSPMPSKKPVWSTCCSSSSFLAPAVRTLWPLMRSCVSTASVAKMRAHSLSMSSTDHPRKEPMPMLDGRLIAHETPSTRADRFQVVVCMSIISEIFFSIDLSRKRCSLKPLL
mmetsp:Transcript_42274/g.116952  ORF Transcript_42274/g.116952 Transcript_42274/m.116952 type:complete len:205 (-) Transcript_42274:1009-1623(-)